MSVAGKEDMLIDMLAELPAREVARRAMRRIGELEGALTVERDRRITENRLLVAEIKGLKRILDGHIPEAPLSQVDAKWLEAWIAKITSDA